MTNQTSLELDYGLTTKVTPSGRLELEDILEIQEFKISPSSLPWWPDCNACAWYGYHIQKEPRMPFPGIFTKIDGINRKFYSGRPLELISNELPSGTLDTGEAFVKSEPIALQGHRPFHFSGKMDAVGTYADGSGFCLVDFKTLDPRYQDFERYWTQLNAYAVCCEYPASGRPRLNPIDKMGLQCLVPSQMLQSKTGRIGYLVDTLWRPLQRDDAALFSFVTERILSVLELPLQPEADQSCSWCQYRAIASRNA